MAEGQRAYEKAAATELPLDMMPEIAREWFFHAEDISEMVSNGSMTEAESKAALSGCPHTTKVVNRQVPYAYSAAVINRMGEIQEHKTYFGEDAPDDFFDTVLTWGEKYMDFLQNGGVDKRDFTEDELFWHSAERGQDSSRCHICDEPFCWDPEDVDYTNRRRVVDHDHVSGSFVGLAHSVCNLHRKEKLRIPVLAHNLSGFDANFIIQELSKVSLSDVGGQSRVPVAPPPPRTTASRTVPGRA